MATVERARRTIASPKAASLPPAAMRKRLEVSTRDVGGFMCHTVAPRADRLERAAVYLHGGGYIGPMAPQHWTLVARLAESGVRVDVPDYGLAPRHTYRDAYPFLTRVYRDLLNDIGPAAITLAGDSAGGGLVLGFAQTLPELELPHPRRLLLIAPWLDLTLANPGLPATERHDPWLCSVGLREAGRAWAGGDDLTDPRLSPLNGELAGLPPITTYIGTRDLFHPDAVLLQERATAARVPMTLTVCPGAVHVYPLTPTPEGRAATHRIIQEITS